MKLEFGFPIQVSKCRDNPKPDVISHRTFLHHPRIARLVRSRFVRRGDFVLMQFGQNEASPINEDPPVNASTRAYERIGQEKTAGLFADGTHTTREGAAFNARAVVSGLRALNQVPLDPTLSEQGRNAPVFKP